ncbi:MAG TPA: hypothetical protein VHG28_02400, partial [Longimicrobiaceae bacterium]|nr:hypothetical protein [Longimicrobiaceae bacterium]
MLNPSCRTLVVLSCTLLTGAAAASAEGADPRRGCVPGGPEYAWMQQALEGWETVSREFLRVDPAPLAPMVLFDTACAWYLAPDTVGSPEIHRRTTDAGVELAFAGGTVAVRALRHGGAVPLPGGDSVPAVATAFAAPYRGDQASFFVMAMPSVWKREPRHAADPDLEASFQSVFAHEMTHTRQVAAVSRRIEA